MCRISAHDFLVDGNPVSIDVSEELLDLKKLYPGEVCKGEDGKRVATVVVKVLAPSSGRFPVLWHNDYFGEISINGGEPKTVRGPWLGFERTTVDLEKGENTIEIKTRAGSGGKWTVGFQVPAASGLTFAP